MKTLFAIAVVFAAFGSSSALAANVQTSNNAAIHCDKMSSDVAYVQSSASSQTATVSNAQVAK